MALGLGHEIIDISCDNYQRENGMKICGNMNGVEIMLDYIAEAELIIS